MILTLTGFRFLGPSVYLVSLESSSCFAFGFSSLKNMCSSSTTLQWYEGKQL